MDDASHASDLTRRANELYWGSEESVNQIAEQLDLSKSALYGMIGPLLSGYGCPICGTEVEFANRTARDRDELECPECGWVGGESETVSFGDEAEEWGHPSSSAVASNPRLVLGGVLLGTAVGLVLFGFMRRR